MPTGCEAYIRTGADAVYDVYAPEVRLNLFARNPHNETMICYNRPYCKYIPPELHGEIRRAGSEAPREYTRKEVGPE